MQFKDPAGVYNAYTSDPINPNNSGANTRGVFQVEVTDGTLSLQGSVGGPFMEIQSFSESGIYEVVLANAMRVVATGNAKAWVVR
jgi:hypothetical protein